jgi:hypothetical protein
VAHIAILPHVKNWEFQASSTHFDILKVVAILYLFITVYLTRLSCKTKYCQKLIELHLAEFDPWQIKLARNT